MQSLKKLTLKLNKLLKKGSQDFIGINLGNNYVKGFVVKDEKIDSYFIEKNDNLSETIKKIWADQKV